MAGVADAVGEHGGAEAGGKGQLGGGTGGRIGRGSVVVTFSKRGTLGSVTSAAAGEKEGGY
jgi:hypothetical protein